MQPAPQHAARENENPGYRDDSPKRGDNVTSNKGDSLLDARQEGGTVGGHASGKVSQGNDQRGALIT